MTLIECVPNVSEGRRDDVVATLARTISGVKGVRLLDYSADVSHHRSVFTFAGEPEAVRAAVLALFAAALQMIDLRAHQGVHPRVGAVDVVPFVPLDGAVMADCVALACDVAALVAERFSIPVFLYEAATVNPLRKRLERIRQGGLPGLAARMATSGEWKPDYGPAVPHPSAGVSVIGARLPLVAFNVNLRTADLGIARRIAAVVRERNGGLPAVKALGVPLAERGLVQVTMNLTNYERTSLAAAFAAVAGEAEREGVAVEDSEIVGLVPEGALAGVDPSSIGLKRFSPNQILEHRLRAVV
jgi:glutamate formiminotransferase/glutamate formiminotransferase/formiminotetrahydrofolate cyclodeaminase